MTDYREILRLSAAGISQRSIARSCACSRNTVSRVLEQAQKQHLEWNRIQSISDGELYSLFFPTQIKEGSRKIPDCEYIHREMAKSGVTLTLLWKEYCDQCRANQEIPLKYTQYCFYYHRYLLTTKATMHIIRKPGEQTEVDWAGQTAVIIDRDTGEIIPANIFVAVLSYSQYAYVEAFLRQDLECWIAVIKALQMSVWWRPGFNTTHVSPSNNLRLNLKVREKTQAKMLKYEANLRLVETGEAPSLGETRYIGIDFLMAKSLSFA